MHLTSREGSSGSERCRNDRGGGSALAVAPCRDGLNVTVLEQTLVYVDRIRVESFMPCGIAEPRELSAEMVHREAAACVARARETYHPPDTVDELSTGSALADAPSSLSLGHPLECTSLSGAGAGHSNPIIGQGVFIASPDSRSICGVLRG